MSMKKSLKIYIQSLDGAGHTNSCIGIGQALLKRGHQVSFLTNEALAGKFVKHGFGELLLKKKPPSNSAKNELENPVETYATLLRKSGVLSARSSLEKCRTIFNAEKSLLQVMMETLVDFDAQIDDILERDPPDVIILAQFFISPAVAKREHRFPWLYQFPCAPLAFYVDERLPPYFSGYSINSDPASWHEFREAQNSIFLAHFRQVQDDLNRACNYQPPSEVPYWERPGVSFMAKSQWLNIYGYPDELDYKDFRSSLSPNCVRVDAFLPTMLEPFELPAGFRKPSDRLIYFSLGSMGCIDVTLMKRIVAVLGKMPHKFIVSKGIRGDEYELPENCWGDKFLPQTRILPLVDLVITHGGNNTVTETFAFGKPMVVMPLFNDQYDNAQRLHDTGFGIRLEAYTFEDQELISAVEKLLNDDALHQRLAAAKQRIESSQSKVKLCEQIEEVVTKFHHHQSD